MNMKEVDWSKWNSKEDNFQKYKHVKSNIIYGKFSKTIPDVSIMILTYKRAKGLKKALESAINQSFEGTYEIVICDDSVYDQKTDELMKLYTNKYNNIIYYRHEKNLGQYANWNRACELCRTNWYCLLHDDDMLKPDYLKVLFNKSKNLKNVGFIGTYFDVSDSRNNVKKQRFLDKLVDIFVKLRDSKLIELSLKDNIKHIFTLSCCLFINKKIVLDCGGLDDDFFPSSDFVFSSKINYFYRTIFIPKYMSIRGIGKNESLKQTVCNDSIKCGYYLTYNICKSLKYNEKKCKRNASFAAVCAEIGVKGYNNVSYMEVKKDLNMKEIFNKKIIIFLINLYSKFNWGKLLFRKEAK